MPDASELSEILAAPLGQVVRRVAEGVAQAQTQLDAAALSTQASLATEFPQLAEMGYQVNWYQMPEVEVELKMAVHFEQQSSGHKPKLFVALFNAKYQASQSFRAEGASTIRFRIVPIPPPSTELPGE